MSNKKSMMKKIIAMMLAAIFVLSTAALLSSCNNGDGDQSAVTNSDTGANGEDVLPEVTDVNYNGYEFNILIANRSGKTPNDFNGTDSSTVMGEAVYRRNMRMESKYGVKLAYEVDLGNSHQGYSKVETQYTAQTNSYDMGLINTYTAAPLTTAGFLYDLNTIPHLDLTKPWWDQTILEGVTISDSVYFMCGDISTTVNDYMYCTIFNKEMYEQYVTDGTDVYQLVSDGKWTLDVLIRLSKLVCEDLNADDVMDCNDKFGLMTWYDECFASIQAAGGRIAKINEEGYVELTLNTERNFDVIRKYMELETAESTINFQDTAGKMTGAVGWPAIFTQSQAMFFMTLLNEVSHFRDMEIDYGILPNPKYNEDQEDWYTTFSAGLAAFVCVPGYQENIDRTGTIIELLGYEAQDTITPAYFSKTLEGQHVRDDESIESLEIIFDNKFVDVGHYYRIGTLNTVLYNVAKSGSAGSFASKYEEVRSQAETDVKNINEGLEQLKDQG